jgi:hypothetical protein
MAKFNYYEIASTQAKLAADGLTDTQIMSDLLLDKSYLSALADSSAGTAAERCEPPVKKTVATFFSAYRTSFMNAVTERQRVLTEQAKPVFWGTKDSQREAWDQKDTRLWTLSSIMDDVKSGHKEIAQQLESILRDAQRMLDRMHAVQASEVVNDKLYPIYDENLGQMGIRVDVAVAKQRQLQESMRTMVGLCGMRLPSREELVAKGLLKEEEAK